MKRRNLPYIITYLLEIILVLLGAVFYRQPLLSVLLLLLVLLPVISIILTKHQSRLLSVNATIKNNNAYKDGIINININANYKGIIPLLNCMIRMTYENLYYPHKKPQEFVFHADKRGDSEFTLPFSVTKAGMFVLKSDRLYITDYLHLYTFSIPIDICIEIPILPEEIEAPSYNKKRLSASNKEGDPTEITTVGGEKTRDIKQLREYRSGDRLKDVHWKLSAKTEELMVREYEEIKELYYLVFPVLDVTNNLQNTLSLYLAIGKDLLREKEPFSTVIYNSISDTFTTRIITEENELYESLYKLYRANTEGYNKAYNKYIEHFPESKEGMILIEGGKVVKKE